MLVDAKGLETALTLPSPASGRGFSYAQNGTSPRLLDDLLDLRHRRRTLFGPARLVVGGDLDRRQGGHVARQLGEIEVLARRTAEGLGEDQLARVLAVDEIDEGLGALGVRAALDDGNALH